MPILLNVMKKTISLTIFGFHDRLCKQSSNPPTSPSIERVRLRATNHQAPACMQPAAPAKQPSQPNWPASLLVYFDSRNRGIQASKHRCPNPHSSNTAPIQPPLGAHKRSQRAALISPLLPESMKIRKNCMDMYDNKKKPYESASQPSTQP